MQLKLSRDSLMFCLFLWYFFLRSFLLCMSPKLLIVLSFCGEKCRNIYTVFSGFVCFIYFYLFFQMKDKACSLVMKASQQNKEMKSCKGSSALTQSVPQSIPSTKNSSATSPNWVASSFRWSKYCGTYLACSQ